jgi:hypothetical protein
MTDRTTAEWTGSIERKSCYIWNRDEESLREIEIATTIVQSPSPYSNIKKKIFFPWVVQDVTNKIGLPSLVCFSHGFWIFLLFCCCCVCVSYTQQRSFLSIITKYIAREDRHKVGIPSTTEKFQLSTAPEKTIIPPGQQWLGQKAIRLSRGLHRSEIGSIYKNRTSNLLKERVFAKVEEEWTK